MINTEEKRILSFITYTPLILIIISVFISVIFLYQEKNKEFEQEKLSIEKSFNLTEKNRVVTVVNNAINYLENQEKQAEEELRTILKHSVTNGYETAYNLYEKYSETKSKEELKTLIKEALRKMHPYKSDRYFFIYSLDGKNILHSAMPKLEGKNLWNYQDAKGTFLLQEMHKILGTKDETFYEWYWYKPSSEDSKKQYKKVGYFKKFEELDLFIGLGVYIDDYMNLVKQRAKRHLESLKYKNDGFISIIDYDGNFLVHQSKKIKKKNLFVNEEFVKSGTREHFQTMLDNKDLNSKFFTFEMLIHKTEVKGDKKVQYTQKFHKWRWFVNLGFYTSDVNSLIAKKKEEIRLKHNKNIKNILIFGSLITIVSLLLAYVISKKLISILNVYKKSLFRQIKDNVEKNKKLQEAKAIAKLGEWQLDLNTMKVKWSDEILIMLGLENEKNLHLSPELLEDLMLDEDWEEFQNYLDSLKEQKTSSKIVVRVENALTKELIWIECRGKYVEKTNTLIGTIQDISEAKKLEIDKIKKEKLIFEQSKMVLMGEMIGNIAHQWRQPLSVISTSATGMKFKKEYGSLNDDEIFLYCDEINKNAQFLSQTIDDFRNFIKDDDKKIKKSFNLKENLESFLTLISGTIKNNDIEIIRDIEEEIILKGYPNELIQCYMNILNNSKDAFTSNGIEDKYIFIETKLENNSAVISFRDNAKGIPRDILPKVFEPYFTTKHSSIGTGLGLHMTYNIIVEGMKGSIFIDNIEYEYKDKSFKGVDIKIVLPI